MTQKARIWPAKPKATSHVKLYVPCPKKQEEGRQEGEENDTSGNLDPIVSWKTEIVP